LAILVPQALVNPAKIAEAIVHASRSSGKPVMACLMGDVSIREAHKLLHDHRVPMVDYPELVGVMLGGLYQRGLRETKVDVKDDRVIQVNKVKVDQIFKEKAGKKFWGESPTREVLAAYGFPLIEGELAGTLEEATRLAEKIGYPLVLKVASDDILHKSDAGVVAVGIKSKEELAAAYQSILDNAHTYDPSVHIDGILIEKMAPKGEEVIVGLKRDPGFGPLLMFGMGGVFVELFKDVAFRVAPLTREDAETMVKETKAFQLLNGWRGGTVYDLEAIYDAILRLGKLAEDFPQIEEIEINPLRVYPRGEGALALDCRMILK
jgi:acetyltransferase